MALPHRLISLAQRAHDDMARAQTNDSSTEQVAFDMAICNVYHVNRHSEGCRV